MKSTFDAQSQVVAQVSSRSVVAKLVDFVRGEDRALLLLLPFVCYVTYFAALAVYVMRSAA